MSHTFLTFCPRPGRTTGVRFHQDDGDRLDPSPRDRQSSTCVKVILSGSDRRAHQSPRGVTRSYDRHQREYREIAIIQPRWSRSSSHRGDAWTVRSPSERTIAIDGVPGDSWRQSDLHQTSVHSQRQEFIREEPLSTAGVWSNPPDLNRTAERSRPNRDAILVWLRHDRGPIAARSWPRSSAIMASFEAKSRPRSPPRSWPIPLPDRIKWPSKSGGNCPVKAMYSPFLFFNFWSIREANSANFEEGLKFSWSSTSESVETEPLKHDNHDLITWFHRIFPLNFERPRGRIRANSLQSTWIKAPFLKQSG